MKLTCPVCRSRYTLEQLATTSALREMVDLAAKFGRSWDLVDEYVTTFRVIQYGGISIEKRLRLLRETARLWETGEFEYRGKRYRTDRARIREALNTVCNLDKFGFQNHNYLKKVLLDGARRVSAAGETASEERKREEDRRRKTEVGSQKPDDGDGPMTAAQWKDKKGVDSLADQIGRDM